MAGFLKRIGGNIGPTEAGAYIGGALFAVLMIYLLGLLLEYVLKERGERVINGVLSRIPAVGSVYETSQKIVQMVEPGAGAELESMASRDVQFRRRQRNQPSCPLLRYLQ